MLNKKVLFWMIACAIGSFIFTEKKTKIGLCSPAKDELWREVMAYMESHPEETASAHEVYNRFLKERYGKYL